MGDRGADRHVGDRVLELGQFAVASILGAGGGALPAIVAAVLVNTRFGPMGVAVAPALKGGPLRRASATIKAAGPVLVGGRELSPRVAGVVALLAPALLAALVVVESFGEDQRLVLDAKAVGVAAAALALALRAPVLVVVALAVVATAAARALG